MATSSRVGMLLPVIALALACGGGSSGGGTTDGGGSTLVTADFSADPAAPPAGGVSLAKGSSSSNAVSLRVDISQVSNVYGAAFDLVYDGTLAEYVGNSPGTVLESGGHTPFYQVTSQPGRLVVSATRVGNVGTVDVPGTGTLITLTFRVSRTGSAPVAFEGGGLFGDQVPPQAIGGLTWLGGTIRGL